MKSFFFHEALFPSGWSKDVRIDVDENGTVTSSVVNSMPNANDEIIDCAIPAMPNCHSHVFQRTMAGLTEYKTSENDSFPVNIKITAHDRKSFIKDLSSGLFNSRWM